MRSFVITISFLLLIFTVSLAPADDGGILDMDIVFRPISLTINGDSVRSCLIERSISFNGFIEFYFAGHGRLLFAAKDFPRAAH